MYIYWNNFVPNSQFGGVGCNFSCHQALLKHKLGTLQFNSILTLSTRRQHPIPLHTHIHTSDAYQFSSVTQSHTTLCDPMACRTPGFPVHHQILELAQTHVHRVGDAIQPSHPLLSPSPPTFNLSQIQGLFQWVSSSHQVAKVLALQSRQWIFRTDFL